MSESVPKILPTREGYDQWAETYDTDGNPLIAMEEPRVDALLGDVGGLKVLDVGCGTGRHAIRLARAGAIVTAVDFSEAMLAQARRKPGAEQIDFRVHDLSKPLPFADAQFDRVICGLVIDHIADLLSLFKEMSRITNPAGAVVISVMHPAMMLKGVQARFHDKESGREVRPESVPNQLSDYVMAAIGADMKLDHLSEHAPDEFLSKKFERARRYVGWPMLCLMRLLRADVYVERDSL